MKKTLASVAVLLLCGVTTSPSAGQRRAKSSPPAPAGRQRAAAPAAPSLQADAPTKALMEKVSAPYRAVKSLSSDISVRQKMGVADQTLSATFRAMRPNFFFLQITGPVQQTMASDGETVYTVMAGQYSTQKASSDGSNLPAVPPLNLFFRRGGVPELFGGERAAGKVSLGQDETVDGVACRVLQAHLIKPMVQDVLIAVGPDRLIRRLRMQNKHGQDDATLEITLHRLKVDPVFAASDFAYKPPADAKLYDTSRSMDANLVAVGKEAPDFSLPRPGGGKISLAAARGENKAVLINFWFYG